MGWGLSDGELFNQVSDKLVKLKPPFYSFIITLSSHHPFNWVPESKSVLRLPEDLKHTLIGNYLNSVNYVDATIGNFVNSLEKKGLLKNSWY